jgi:hypothetical protein
VLCLAGRTELDRAAAEMMAQALKERGVGTRVLPPIAVSQGALGQLDLQGMSVVCLSYLHPQPQVYARYICRRLRRRAPHMKLVVCCWDLAPGASQTDDLKKQMAADAVFVSLEACLDQVNAWVSTPALPGEPPPVAPDSEQAQRAALHDLGLASAKDRRFDEVSRSIAQAFGVPIALVSVRDELHRSQPGAAGPAQEVQAVDQTAKDATLDAQVIAANEVLVSEDVTKDPRFSDDPLVVEKGIRFYAGAPLRTSAGPVIGTLCVIDTNPRRFPEPDRRRLQEMADELMSQIERRSAESPGNAQDGLVTIAAKP